MVRRHHYAFPQKSSNQKGERNKRRKTRIKIFQALTGSHKGDLGDETRVIVAHYGKAGIVLIDGSWHLRSPGSDVAFKIEQVDALLKGGNTRLRFTKKYLTTIPVRGKESSMHQKNTLFRGL